MEGSLLDRVCITAVVLIFGMSGGCTSDGPVQETLDHHVEVDLGETWSSTPWDPARDARGVPLPQSKQTTLTSQFVLPDDLVSHGSVLLLEGLSWSAAVTVNGHELDAVSGGPSPAAVALGQHLKPGTNTLTVELTGAEDAPTLLVGHTKPAATLAVPPRLVLRPAQGLDQVVATLSEDGVDLSATTRGDTEGWSVQFSAWRDGERIADWGTAVVSEGRAQLDGVPWSGPKWPDENALFMLQATIRNAAGQWSTLAHGVQACDDSRWWTVRLISMDSHTPCSA